MVTLAWQMPPLTTSPLPPFHTPTGNPPFNADSPEEIFENILDRRIEWPDEDDEDMSPECRDLIDKLLNPDRDRRIGHRGAGEGEEGVRTRWAGAGG